MIGFIGTGKMGRPMAERLAQAGYGVKVWDKDAEAARNVVGVSVAASLEELAREADTVITMLPNGEVVRRVLEDALPFLTPGVTVVDMSSSAPTGTIALGEKLREAGISLIDAPVSGGVARAVSGELTIMVGGDCEPVRPMLEPMGKVVPVGKLGAGHALKALNNYVSAAGLAAACEAIFIGQKFEVDSSTMLAVLNASTGQNYATKHKIEQFVLSGKFASGFTLDLLAKDVRTAASLAQDLGVNAPWLAHSGEFWTEVEAAMAPGVDHTEFYRFLEELNRGE